MGARAFCYEITAPSFKEGFQDLVERFHEDYGILDPDGDPSDCSYTKLSVPTENMSIYKDTAQRKKAIQKVYEEHSGENINKYQGYYIDLGVEYIKVLTAKKIKVEGTPLKYETKYCVVEKYTGHHLYSSSDKKSCENFAMKKAIEKGSSMTIKKESVAVSGNGELNEISISTRTFKPTAKIPQLKDNMKRVEFHRYLLWGLARE